VPRRTTIRIIKTPVFIAGEGKSERGYGRWLGQLARNHGVPVAIKAEALQGGDPLDLVAQAKAKLETIEKYRGNYSIKGLLLDDDLLGQNRERDEQAVLLARKKRIHLIWQKPTHEAFLLRHFPRNQKLLKKVWPKYEKGLDATHYEKMLTLDHLLRARGMEPDLNDFLIAMGWH